VTYPRVDTTFLPMISIQVRYFTKPNELCQLTQPLLEKNKKSPKVLMTKVTDHHAIIPTGIQNNYNTINNKCMIV
jgi:DNA topoisomerase-3